MKVGIRTWEGFKSRKIHDSGVKCRPMGFACLFHGELQKIQQKTAIKGRYTELLLHADEYF